MDTIIPAVIRESAPSHAPRLDLVSATRRGQGLALASAADDCREAFEAAEELPRVASAADLGIA